MSEALLRIDSGVKRYRRREVLKVAHLEIMAGDRVQLVGDNGSGKSTLLRILAGIATLSGGVLMRSDAVRRLKVGYLPQQGGIYEELTLRENIRIISSAIANRTPVGIEHLPIVDELGLLPYLDRPVSVLSDGMKRLAAFLCVWAGRPDLLIADEPTAGVDQHNEEVLLKHVETEMPVRGARIFSGHAEQRGYRNVIIAEGTLMP